MPLHHSFSFGSLRCHLLEGGMQRLDGGAMFGVVPKPLWSRKIAPDERNRILLAMHCLLIEHDDGLVLVDTALGNKEDAKFLDIYGVENAGDPGPTQLEDALQAAGFEADDVRWVINTHLHFDHAGGNTVRRSDGSAVRGSASGPLTEPSIKQTIEPSNRPTVESPIRLAFPNATYIVQKNELEFARHTNERTRASYFPHNFEPVAEAGKWKLIEGNLEILPGIFSRHTPGHVPWHQSIVLRSGGETAIFLADLVPTAAHLPLPYIMGYDLEPMRTLESKRALYREALAEGWWFIFEHDANVAMGRAVAEGKSIGLADMVYSGGAV